MYTISSNGVKNEVITTGAIKKLFDRLSKKVGDSSFNVVINAEEKKGIINYDVKIQSTLTDGQKGFIQSEGIDLLTVCQQAVMQFKGKLRHIKSNRKKQQKQQ